MDMAAMTRDARGVISPYARTAPRLVAMTLDLLVIAAWAGVAAGIGIAVRRSGVHVASPSAFDALAFVTLVLPVIVTFAVQEASPRQGTFGKRFLGLWVVDAAGARPTFPRALGRSAVKFAPWQLAHTAVFNLMADSTATGFVVLAVAAQLLVVVSVVAMTVDPRHRALHDWVAGTRVITAAG
jgi:uncharacterized RDD family membrane protein YckC